MRDEKPKREDLKSLHTLGESGEGRGFLRRGKKLGYERSQVENVRGECVSV